MQYHFLSIYYVKFKEIQSKFCTSFLDIEEKRLKVSINMNKIFRLIQLNFESILMRFGVVF